MRDTIYRDEAVEICERWRQRAKEHHDRNGWYMADILLRFMKEMPSADRPQGEAPLEHGYMWTCPKCELEVHSDFDTCPRCGNEREDRPQEWIPCSERLPETDNTNEINEFDALLVVRPKKHPERTPQVYIGKLCSVEGDDGSGNFWGIKTAPCEWTIWGWSYFQEPEVLAWMPLPKPYMKGADDEASD